MEDKRNEIELRSNKVRRLLGDFPKALETWGIVVLIVITIELILAVCLIPYPHSNGESILQHLIIQSKG